MQPKLLLAALAAALGLSACANLDGKSAYEVAKISRDRTFTHDYSFNFDGEMRAYGKAKTAEEIAKDTAEAKAKAEIGVLADVPGEPDKQLENQLADEGMEEFIAQAADFMGEHPTWSEYIANGRVKYSGALDLSTKKLEITPELELNNRNEYTRVKMPMLFDGENMSLTVEPPATIPLVIDMFTDLPMRHRLLKEPLQIRAADIEFLKTLPLKHIGEAAVKAGVYANDALPPEAFTMKEMDAFGKQHGARYRVQYQYNPAHEQMAMQAFQTRFSEELDKLKQTPEQGIEAEAYDKAKEFVAEVLKTADSAPKVSEKTLPVWFDSYYDRQGRLKAQRSTSILNGKKHTFNIVADAIYSRYGKPEFRFQPQNGRVITWPELMKAFENESNKYHVEAAVETESSETEADSVETAVEAAKAAVAAQ